LRGTCVGSGWPQRGLRPAGGSGWGPVVQPGVGVRRVLLPGWGIAGCLAAGCQECLARLGDGRAQVRA